MSRTTSRREQYSQATKAALLEAATRRLAGHRFSGTALEDVATDIQATRGAVYHHFAGKAALFEAVFQQLETAAVNRVVLTAETAKDAWQAPFLPLETFWDICWDRSTARSCGRKPHSRSAGTGGRNRRSSSPTDWWNDCS